MITQENTKTLYDLVQNSAKKYKDQIFMLYEREDDIYEKTYIDLAEDSEAFAIWADKTSEELGHKIHAALFGKLSYRYAVAISGLAAAGAVSVPVDLQMSNEDLIERINEADIDVLLFDWEQMPKLEIVRSNCPNVKYYICLQNLHKEMKVESKSIKDIISGYKGQTYTSTVTEDDIVFFIYTSGTTGKGKGVMLTHGNIINNAFSSNEPEIYYRTRNLNVLPVHHVFCLSCDIYLSILCGNTICLCPDITKLVDYIQLFHPMSVRMVPMMVKLLVNRVIIYQSKHPELTLEEAKNELYGKQLYRLISGGGYLAPDLAKKVFDMGMITGQGYGMSECSPVISSPDYGNLEKLTSVGHVNKGTKVRIVDGEIQVKSPSVMKGYYKQPELTKEALTEDGWLCTGDLGYVDEDGFIYLTGRKKNLIILSNGENVAPEMIEKVFDGESLIMDILAYGQGEIIAAEIYPNFEYAQVKGIENIEEEINKIINEKNELLPTYAKIAKVTLRKIPFVKNSSKKIVRSKFFEEKENEKKLHETLRMPETDRQKTLYDIVEKIIGHNNFGIDSNLYECGLDSLGSTMIIEEVHSRLKQSISLGDLLECKSILGFEKLMDENAAKEQIDLSVREVYPLTKMQLYFGYVIRNNTTGNLPFSLKLDSSVDLTRLKAAIYDVIDAHPALKGAIHPGTDNPYLALFRRDNYKINIPIIKASDAECLESLKKDLVPFSYSGDDDLCHIKLYESEIAKYLFFDVSHIMGDGVTMNILMEDIEKRYKDEEIEKEDFTFYEFALEYAAHIEDGSLGKDAAAAGALMKGLKLKRSILTTPGISTYDINKHDSIHNRFEHIVKKELLYFCKKNGVTENVMFITAFNYCISLFSDEKDVFCNSIHSGRTDSRWTRIAGPLFLTYYNRYTQTPHESVGSLLKKTGNGIMEAMKNKLSMPRQGEMFIQYQGDILETPSIGGVKTERVPQQLDALPFHFQIMSDKDGYYYELRYWEERFDRKQLEIFLDCYESVLCAMLNESYVRKLRDSIPAKNIPMHIYVTAGELNKAAGGRLLPDISEDRKVKVYVLDENFQKKPYGGWGTLFIQDYQPIFCQNVVENPYKNGVNVYMTNRTARILPDGTLDFLERSGRTVLTDGSGGRKFFDLTPVERTLLSLPGVQAAEAYLAYESTKNEMTLRVDVSRVPYAGLDITEDLIKDTLRERLGNLLVPEVVNLY